MTEIRLGVLLWSQATDWPAFAAAARRSEELGYEHIWTWDHLYAIFGDPYQPIFEGWATLAAWAATTHRARLGLMVGANTLRNPGIVAKLATTLDHISDGRAILGLGGAWFETEHTATGIDFGSGFGERLDRLDEAVAALRTLLDGGEVTSAPMHPVHGPEVGGREHVDVVEKEGGILPEVSTRMQEPASRLQDVRFLSADADLYAHVPLLHESDDPLGVMVDVDHQPIGTGLHEPLPHPIEEGPPPHLDQGLGRFVGQGPQPCSQAGRQNHRVQLERSRCRTSTRTSGYRSRRCRARRSAK